MLSGQHFCSRAGVPINLVTADGLGRRRPPSRRSAPPTLSTLSPRCPSSARTEVAGVQIDASPSLLWARVIVAIDKDHGDHTEPRDEASSSATTETTLRKRTQPHVRAGPCGAQNDLRDLLLMTTSVLAVRGSCISTSASASTARRQQRLTVARRATQLAERTTPDRRHRRRGANCQRGPAFATTEDAVNMAAGLRSASSRSSPRRTTGAAAPTPTPDTGNPRPACRATGFAGRPVHIRARMRSRPWQWGRRVSFPQIVLSEAEKKRRQRFQRGGRVRRPRGA